MTPFIPQPAATVNIDVSAGATGKLYITLGEGI